MSASLRVCGLLLIVGVLTACANDGAVASGSANADQGQPQNAAEPTPRSATPRSTATPTPLPTSTPLPVTATQDDQDEDDGTVSASERDESNRVESADDGTTEPTPLPGPSPTPDAPASPCVRLTDFSIDAQNQSWFIVNDNVMGGRSSGGPSFDGSSMVFEGEINTDGGGFSSVRVQLGANTLTGFSEIAVRARTDGRSYKLILEDSLASRDRRVSQQGSLAFAPTTEWQTAQIAFADLEPRIFGREVQTDAFRSDLATQLGVMISDGVDGPFRIEIDWIDVCT